MFIRGLFKEVANVLGERIWTVVGIFATTIVACTMLSIIWIDSPLLVSIAYQIGFLLTCLPIIKHVKNLESTALFCSSNFGFLLMAWIVGRPAIGVFLGSLMGYLVAGLLIVSCRSRKKERAGASERALEPFYGNKSDFQA
jgi:hypothetical protein